MEGPTPKQEAFARFVVSGMNPSEAYRAAGYSCNMAPNHVRREAYRVLHRPNVSQLVERLKAEAESSAVWSRELAIERLSDVNARAYSRIVGTPPDRQLERASASAFFDSLDRLNDMCGVGAPKGDAPCIVLGVEAVRHEGRAAVVDDL